MDRPWDRMKRERGSPVRERAGTDSTALATWRPATLCLFIQLAHRVVQGHWPVGESSPHRSKPDVQGSSAEPPPTHTQIHTWTELYSVQRTFHNGPSPHPRPHRWFWESGRLDPSDRGTLWGPQGFSEPITQMGRSREPGPELRSSGCKA